MAHLTCLDVGHGNCSIISADEIIVVIDAGPGSSLLEYVDDHGITVIDLVLISHADADHLSGLTALLAADHITIRHVTLNADSVKDSEAWDDILYTLNSSSLNGELTLKVGWHIGEEYDYEFGDLFLKALAPTPYLTGKGVGGTDREGRRINSNSLSAMVRVDYLGSPIALLPGDLDSIGLDAFLEAMELNTTLRPTAPILVWPHHGGLPGGMDPSKFARKLLDIVGPEHVIFSNGRGRGNNPRPEIVAEVLRCRAVPRISCTQLSKSCANQKPPPDAWNLHNLPGKGRIERKSCSGSMRFNLKYPIDRTVPVAAEHQIFITTHAPTALCRVTS